MRETEEAPSSETHDARQVAGAALGVAAPAASLALRARRARVNGRRRLHDDPEPADLPFDFGAAARTLVGGFVESDVARLVRQRTRGVETDKVAVTVARLRRALRELDAPIPSLLLARETARDVTFVGAATQEAQERLLAPTLAEQLDGRLGCLARVARTPDGDLAIGLEHLRAADMVAIGDRTDDEDLWLAVAVADTGARVHVNLAELPHLLVAGADAGALLTTAVLGAATSLPPDRLAVVLVAAGDTLPPELRRLPHVRRHANTLGEVLDELREEVVRRSAAVGGPRLLLVVDELDGAADRGELAALLGHAGGRLHLVAATGTTGNGLPPGVLSAVTGRLVLRVADADASARLLGRAGAEELGSGEVLARVMGREPVRARAMRVEAPDLAECLALMGRGTESESAADVLGPAVVPAEQVAQPEVAATPADVEEERGAAEEPGGDVTEPDPPPTGPPRLTIRCFGPLAVERDGRPVTDWERAAAREFLAFLALRGRGGISRDQVIEALWPDRDEASSQQIMHSRLYTLRKAIAEDKRAPFIHFASGEYRLDDERVWVDAAAFEAALDRTKRGQETEQLDALREAVELYRGELLADHCPEWALGLQDEYRARALDALNRLGAAAAKRVNPTNVGVRQPAGSAGAGAGGPGVSAR